MDAAIAKCLAPLFCLASAGCVDVMTSDPPSHSYARDISTSPNSRYTLAWEHNLACTTFSCEAFARAYAQNGSANTPPTVVTPTMTGKYSAVEVATQDNGDFGLLYDSYVYNSANSSASNRIYFRRFGQNAMPIGASQLIGYGNYFDVATDWSGGFIAAYGDTAQHPVKRLFTQRFNALGNSTGTSTLQKSINTEYLIPQIRTICNGNFAISYQIGTDASNLSTYFRVYSAAGVPLGPEVLVGGMSKVGRFTYRPNGELDFVVDTGTNIVIKRLMFDGTSAGADQVVSPSSNVFGGLGGIDIASNKCGQEFVVSSDYNNKDLYFSEYFYNHTFKAPRKISQAPLNYFPRISAGDFMCIMSFTRANPSLGTPMVYHHRQLRSDIAASYSYDVYPPGCASGPSQKSIGQPVPPGYGFAWSPNTYLTGATSSAAMVTHPGGAFSGSVTYQRAVSTPCCTNLETYKINFHKSCPI